MLAADLNVKIVVEDEVATDNAGPNHANAPGGLDEAAMVRATAGVRPIDKLLDYVPFDFDAYVITGPLIYEHTLKIVLNLVVEILSVVTLLSDPIFNI